VTCASAAVGSIILVTYADPGRTPSERKHDSKQGGNKSKLSPEELERMKKMTPDEKASYIKRKKLESTMTSAERREYVKMTSEGRFAFRKKLERRQMAKRKLHSSSRQDRPVMHDPNASSSSNAVPASQKPIPASREDDRTGEQVPDARNTGPPGMRINPGDSASQPQEDAVNGDIKEPSTATMDVASIGEVHQKQNGTKRPHEVEEKQQQDQHIAKRLRTGTANGQDIGEHAFDASLPSVGTNSDEKTDHG